MSPGALVWNWLAVHTVSGMQTRLLYDVGAVVSYWLAKSHVVSAEHTRSAFQVASVEMYWPAACAVVGTLQITWSWHARSDVYVAAVVSHCVAEHTTVSWHSRSLSTPRSSDVLRGSGSAAQRAMRESVEARGASMPLSLALSYMFAW